jgi:hypothetical protein
MRAIRLASLVSSALALSLLCSGCGKTDGSGFKFVPVSGRVMLDNKPLANATVRFQFATADNSQRPPDAYGETDDQGNYTLKPVVEGRKEVEGTVAGKHLVQISLFDRDHPGPQGPVERVPARYNTNSALFFDVPPEGAKGTANFNLTSR